MAWPCKAFCGTDIPSVISRHEERVTATQAKIRRRKIHVDLPEEIHRWLRVKAALEDTSMQVFVARVVAKAVKDVPLPESGNHRSRKSG